MKTSVRTSRPSRIVYLVALLALACGLSLLLLPSASFAQQYVSEMHENTNARRWISEREAEYPSRARLWMPLIADESGVVYIRTGSIRQLTDTSVHAWIRKDYYLPYTYRDKKGQSILEYVEIYCENGWTITPHSTTWYSMLGGRGNKIATASLRHWRYAEADDTDYLLAEYACSHWKRRGSDIIYFPGVP